MNVEFYIMFTQRADSTTGLVVPNVEVRMEAQDSVPPVSLHNLLQNDFITHSLTMK